MPSHGKVESAAGDDLDRLQRYMSCLHPYFRASLLLVFAIMPCACASLPSEPAPAAQHAGIAPPASRPSSTDLSGHPINPLAKADDYRGTVLLFITNDCPISNSYAPEIHRLCEAYEHQGIAFYLVYSDPDLKLPEAQQHYKDYAYKCPALFDPQHELAKKAGASVTPEAAVFLPDGQMIYRGRIDDLYQDYGKARYVATTHELKDVLESIVQNHPLALHTTEAVGCPIPR